jgi:hypothetical protein
VNIRVKTKKVVFNVECSPTLDLTIHKDNLKISIQRNNNEVDVDKVRHFLKKLIFLTDKHHVPTIFLAVDMSNFHSTDVWHCLYKLNKDKDCPYVALRIIKQKSDFSTETFRLQILESLYSGSTHERLIALYKINVLQEIDITCSRKSRHLSNGQLPIDLQSLLIKRRSRDSFKDFVIHYLGQDN